MCIKNWSSWWSLLITIQVIRGADDDYNIVNRDGSFQFGYDTPDSYHHANANRNNIVNGQFGGRNPETGAIDSTIYTAGPRGYRPVGKNVHRKYDLNQNGPRPVGSPDDPYYDPYEDPSYKFAFRTRTYNRQESANRAGDVSGKYNYIDDVGELHNVEFIAGKNTGFHVKTPFPDSNPRAYYGRLYFRGRGKPIPRGRTSIQRGTDGSYRFVSAGPDQRRTEVSDSSGHVRGSYTYLDDKGVQHSVHYIAGPEIGYKVLKNVKGPHLPTLYPFGQPEIIPPDFYDYTKDDVFDAAASGHVKPPGSSRPDNNGGSDDFDSDFDKPGGRPGGGQDLDLVKPGGRPQVGGGGAAGRPQVSGGGAAGRPQVSGGGVGGSPEASGPSESTGGGDVNRPSFGDDGDFEGELFGPSGGPPRPTSRPSDDGSYKPDSGNDGSYVPPGDLNQDDGSYKPDGASGSSSETPRPGLGVGPPSPGRPFAGSALGVRPPNPGPPSSADDYDDVNGLFGSESNGRPPAGGPTVEFQGDKCERCKGTIFRNVGDRLFTVPPGVSVRAHVQSIDLLPLVSKVPSPSEQYNEEMGIKTERLNLAASDVVTNTTTIETRGRSVAGTTTQPTTVPPTTDITTVDG